MHNEENRQVILNNIEQHGCHIVMLEADNYLPAFVYSIGLFKRFGHPEIICFGMSPNLMGDLVNIACEMIKNGATLQPGKLYNEFLNGYDIQFLPVDKAFYTSYLGYAGWFYDWSFEFPALQLIWPDKAHLFPWNEGFNPDWKFKQPLLDRNTDFKFYEERNLGVFTTRQVLEGAPILYVSHNEDGDWQFHSSEKPDLGDARIVCLEEITKLDPSINEVYYLQYGWDAWRESVDKDWETAERENKEE